MQIVGKNCDRKTLLDPSKVAIPIERFVALERQSAADVLAVEEPLEIRLGYGPKNCRRVKSVSVTMRTPGFDFELAAGFLLTEGVIRDANDIDQIEYVGGNSVYEEPPNERTDAANRLLGVTQSRLKGSVVCVQLRADVEVDMASLSRNFYTTSSCGVCGKASLSALRTFCHLARGIPSKWMRQFSTRSPWR